MTVRGFGVTCLLDYLSASDELETSEDHDRAAASMPAQPSMALAVPGSGGELPAVRLLLILSTVSARDRWILSQRTLSSAPLTLQQLADQLHLTRERVRQIESRGLRYVNMMATSPEATNLSSALQLLTTRLAGTAYSLSQIQDAINQYLRVPWGESLCREASKYVRAAIGFTETDAKYAFRRSRQMLWLEITEAFSAGVNQEEETAFMRGLAEECEVPLSFVQEVRASLNVRALNGVLLPWAGTLADKAYRVLLDEARPQTFEQLAASLASEGCSPSTLKNYLLSDSRFMRIGRSRFALSGWGLEEYSGVRDAIRRRIKASGGKVLLQRLLVDLPQQYGVAEASVRTYASGVGFKIDSLGFISETGSHATSDPSNSDPARNRNIFKHGDHWYLRLELGPDLIRGSGRAIPVAAAAELALCPGRVTERTVGGSIVRFSWNGAQPAIGSVRKIIEELGGKIDDLLFIELTGPDEPAQAFVVPSPASVADPTARLSAFCGVRTSFNTQQQAIELIGRSIGLTPASINPATIRLYFLERRDPHALTFLPGNGEAKSAEPALDSLLQELDR